MTKETIFQNAAQEVQIKAQSIASREKPNEAKEEYDREIINAHQELQPLGS